MNYNLVPEQIRTNKGINRNSGKSDYSEYILGFNSFDKSEIYAVNQLALSEIKNALENGRKIEFLPLTDSLGTDEHNQKLAEKRAKSAIKFLKLPEDKINIVYPKQYYFPNNRAFGRVLNRSIIVRIK